jgi:hypothetical protein
VSSEDWLTDEQIDALAAHSRWCCASGNCIVIHTEPSFSRGADWTSVMSTRVPCPGECTCWVGDYLPLIEEVRARRAAPEFEFVWAKGLNKSATLQVWKDGVLFFSGVDAVSAMTEDS